MIFTWRNLFLFTVIIFHRYFLFTYFPYACIFAPPPPFQKQSSTRRCAPCYELCDHLKRNASFETYNPRRSWRVMILSETYRGPERLSLSVVWSEDPGEAMAVLNARRK